MVFVGSLLANGDALISQDGLIGSRGAVPQSYFLERPVQGVLSLVGVRFSVEPQAQNGQCWCRRETTTACIRSR